MYGKKEGRTEEKRTKFQLPGNVWRKERGEGAIRCQERRCSHCQKGFSVLRTRVRVAPGTQAELSYRVQLDTYK